MNDDLDGMGNYCANFAYLLGSFRNAGLRTGDYSLTEAFRWMAVSDRIASRLGAGADNLWSPIYWLYLRRAAEQKKWNEICGWINPIVSRTSDGPVLPNPTDHPSCFDYVKVCTEHIFSAHEKYLVVSHIPTEQVRMLLVEMCRVRSIEEIGQDLSTAAYEMVASKWGLAERSLSAKDAKLFAQTRDFLTKP